MKQLKLFDNKVQETKYKVLREVAYQAWQGNEAFSEFNEIAQNVIPKGEPPQTCCIYKDRAVIAERIRLALGGSRHNDNVVQVIDIACDECPEAVDALLTAVWHHVRGMLSSLTGISMPILIKAGA